MKQLDNTMPSMYSIMTYENDNLKLFVTAHYVIVIFRDKLGVTFGLSVLPRLQRLSVTHKIAKHGASF